jgi:hypothetical protein
MALAAGEEPGTARGWSIQRASRCAAGASAALERATTSAALDKEIKTPAAEPADRTFARSPRTHSKP